MTKTCHSEPRTYHPTEIEQILSTLVLLVDTREQPNKRAERRYAQTGLPIRRQKLDFGDYSCAATGLNGEEISLANRVVIERKMSTDELCMCFCRERERFKREMLRAKESGAAVYLLIENSSLDSMYAHKYRSAMHENALVGSLFDWMLKFGITPLFVSEERTGKVIANILLREMRWYLESQGERDA